jgi:predicted nucleic acid-binding protein
VSYVVLDTDVVSRLHKRTLPASLLGQLVGMAPCVTFVTLGELEKWAVLRAWGHQRRASLAHWLDGVPRLGYDDEVARVWGRLAGEAVRRGRTRPTNDMWNAACCLVEGLPLATLNVKDYTDFADHHGLTLITPA